MASPKNVRKPGDRSNALVGEKSRDTSVGKVVNYLFHRILRRKGKTVVCSVPSPTDGSYRSYSECDLDSITCSRQALLESRRVTPPEKPPRYLARNPDDFWTPASSVVDVCDGPAGGDAPVVASDDNHRQNIVDVSAACPATGVLCPYEKFGCGPLSKYGRPVIGKSPSKTRSFGDDIARRSEVWKPSAGESVVKTPKKPPRRCGAKGPVTEGSVRETQRRDQGTSTDILEGHDIRGRRKPPKKVQDDTAPALDDDVGAVEKEYLQKVQEVEVGQEQGAHLGPYRKRYVNGIEVKNASNRCRTRRDPPVFPSKSDGLIEDQSKSLCVKSADGVALEKSSSTPRRRLAKVKSRPPTPGDTSYPLKPVRQDSDPSKLSRPSGQDSSLVRSEVPKTPKIPRDRGDGPLLMTSPFSRLRHSSFSGALMASGDVSVRSRVCLRRGKPA